jgi:two-component system, NtrC family, nitrogen regulation sensor histidine kinase NtrY
MEAPGTLLSYEKRIVGTALLAVVPLAAAALLLVWAGDFPQVVTWTIILLVIATIVIASVLLREVVVYPLRTLANVIGAVREEDYSMRAREASEGKMFGQVFLELNALSSTMRQRHLAALEAAGLVRAVIAEVDAAIFAFDSASRLELVNREGERLLGRDAGDLLGKPAADLGLDDLLEGVEGNAIERAFAGVTARWSIRVSRFRQEGESHRLLVVSDISRALRQEEIRAWRRVVRVLGHELNNSLAPIKSIAGSLEEELARQSIDERLQSDLAKGLAIIGRRADGVARFLSTYSELARLPEPKFRSVSVAALSTRVASLDKRISIDVAGGPDIRVEADETQLEQAIINIVKNAVDAALETGGGVSIAWRRGNGAAEIIVADEGPGLGTTSNLFVPFFTTKPGGSGIGLVLSRQIAEAHGGTLTLRDREIGKGCEAVFRLPLSRE